jgi:hypothetical protein
MSADWPFVQVIIPGFWFGAAHAWRPQQTFEEFQQVREVLFATYSAICHEQSFSLPVDDGDFPHGGDAVQCPDPAQEKEG